MARAAKQGVQLEFPCLNHGGYRPKSGRKAKKHADGSRMHASHARRARLAKSRPLHVTIELEPGLPSLRSPLLAAVACDAIERSNQREDFRVVHVCLLSNHLHLICEAEGREALASGIQGLNLRLAKAVNRQMERRGRVVRERYHVHVLESLAEVRNAVQYVLRNAERRGLDDVWLGEKGNVRTAPRPDPYSSAAWFPYWHERELALAPEQLAASVVRPARTYVMRLAFEGAPLSFRTPLRAGVPAARNGGRGRPVERSERVLKGAPGGP